MILIFGYDKYEQGTEHVIDWLSYYGADFLKVTFEDFSLNNLAWNFNISNNTVFYNGINITEVTNVVWYRRLATFKEISMVDRRYSSEIYSQLNAELKREHECLFNYLFHSLRNKKWLPKNTLPSINKLLVLRKADEAGLKTPKTMVLNTKKDLIQFLKEYSGKVVTKPISDTFYYKFSTTTSYLAYTAIVTLETAMQLGNYFAPSLFQECINSEMELRVFYIDGKCFCQAALCPDSGGDVVDIKLRREINEIIYVPFVIPKLIQNKIARLMKSLMLTMGCLDLLVTKNNEYVFLEVNPGGQYLFESQNCNFNLEKEIAEWLIKNDQYD